MDAARTSQIKLQVNEEGKDVLHPLLRAAELGNIDEVISPHSRKKFISREPALTKNKELKNPWKKHGRLPL